MKLTPAGQIWLTSAQDGRLQGHDSRVLAVLVDHRNHETGLAWPSAATIANILGSDRRNVGRSIKRLIEFGYLKDAGAGFRGVRMFSICLPASHMTHVIYDPGSYMTHDPASHMTHNPLNKPSDKKEKSASLDFEVDIDLCSFGDELGFTPSDLQEERAKALDYWKARPDKAPTGCPIAAFKGWLRYNKPKRKAEPETTGDTLKGKEAQVAEGVTAEDGEAWRKVFARLSEGKDGTAFKMDLSRATLTNGPKGSLNLEAEKFTLSRILSKWADIINPAWERESAKTLHFGYNERKAA